MNLNLRRVPTMNWRSRRWRCCLLSTRIASAGISEKIISRPSCFLPGCARFPLRGMNEPCDADTQKIEGNHGRCENAHAANVGCGGQSPGNNEDHKNCVTKGSPHPARADEAHEG